ncbi:MAG: heterodisulfide reductase-related iron-sulfur binding cluster [Deltaproteobacteria bacterium]|nr:heterodisulfide reductase-related iron-sulfur binding cluster [Deltaproteobacteria bacterium]
MRDKDSLEFSYFPGCSVVTTSWESNQSLLHACRSLGLNLKELEDWNCCGSSSAFAIDPELGFNLSARNLSLAEPDRPLLVMCPRCLHHLRETHQILRQDKLMRRAQERRWKRPISPDLEIIHFLEAVVKLGPQTWKRDGLEGLKVMPYYGCTLFRPPALRRERYYQGEVENVLAALGAVPVVKALTNRCCGSFLSAVRPGLVTQMVNEIIQSAVTAGAECLVTVCAMCQLNLEIRCTLEQKLPIFHFSEILALALEAKDYESWFARHLVDPRPLLIERGLLR